jgi:hypothetical protein
MDEGFPSPPVPSLSSALRVPSAGVRTTSFWKKLIALGAAGAIVPAAFVIYAIPPDESSWYPRCVLHSVTGLHCPGCGATRAVHALVHGEVEQAVAFNLLFLLSLPAFVYYGFRLGAALLSGRDFQPSSIMMLVVRCWLVALIVFGIVRNLPFYPFDLLAPHKL